jgi:internalin A
MSLQTRLQDEYNNAIRGSDIFVMLFFTKVGKYTTEEFETAFGEFKATKKPLIYTYFKDAATSTGSLDREHLQSLWDFQDKLKGLGHFYTVYKNLDDLKFKFDQQLDKLVENIATQLVQRTQAPQQATKPPAAAMPAKGPPIIGITLHTRAAI